MKEWLKIMKLEIKKEVLKAINEGKGVVALESTIISHGCLLYTSLTIYVDDIDGIGHNSQDETYGIPRASTEAGRIDNVINALSVIDAKIEELVLAYKALSLIHILLIGMEQLIL